MRPWLILLITVAAVGAWWELRSIAGGWATFAFVYSGAALILLAPVVVALMLLHRRWLGRWTSTWFIVQAVALVLVGLLFPDAGDTDPTAPVAVLSGSQSITPGLYGMLAFVSAGLGLLWLLLIPVTALCAWKIERAPAPVE
ncbi:hypothetical protein [Kutzneria buriramensis]|uniref:Uncharacterized protein n=1 Tax=Kutzneria buriramensis TaxID=1045776 RepID=A0A3E0H784_9PSEU|nr:hypothetical protein [Kutzneria buriramensis]REH39295.1 hypothetical protein BCF44_113150 [Kutzneria buriramensis]